jgi:hypothetical protein
MLHTVILQLTGAALHCIMLGSLIKAGREGSEEGRGKGRIRMIQHESELAEFSRLVKSTTQKQDKNKQNFS